ncbi:MAG: carboxypeptidase regulatory-like domain-containing protein [Thermoleophilia bacterium]|nr:carboxypeptidase regulatory-like domain-containing protein [Thermoleophilia bacterium]
MTALAFLAALLSGLTGIVSRGPVTPVCRPDQPCSKPYAHAVLLFSASGVTRSVRADEKGVYRIGLAPGRYAVRVRDAQFGWRPLFAVVPRGRYAHVNVSVDTGIR